MSKTITSPIARWQGTVTLSDPLTLPQAERIEQAQSASQEKINELDETEVEGIKPILLSELDANVPNIKIVTLVRLGDLVVDDTSQNAL